MHYVYILHVIFRLRYICQFQSDKSHNFYHFEIDKLLEIVNDDSYEIPLIIPSAHSIDERY